MAGGVRVAAAAFALAVVAQAAEAPDAALEQVRDTLGTLLPEVQRSDVRRTEAPGLFEVQRGAAFGYVTADGRYLVRGDLIDLRSGVVLTELRRRSARLDAVQKLSARAIDFSPPADFVQQTVFIFVDVDCNYCRQLHQEVGAFNKRGIRVRYLFYPRFGLQSDAFRRAQGVYCSADPPKALAQLFAGGALKDAKTDCDNPVAEQYNAAVAMGIKGTPMMVLPDGSTLYGFINAAGLEELLKNPA